MGFSSYVTDGIYKLFINIRGIDNYGTYISTLDIKLTGRDSNGNFLPINKAMSELLIRKANVFTLLYGQATSEACFTCGCLIKQAAQELIREGNFDLLFCK